MAGTKADSRIEAMQARADGQGLLLAHLMDRIAALETKAKDEALPQRLDEHIKQVDQRFKDVDEFNQMRFHGHGMRLNELSAKVQAVSYGDELKGIYHRLCDLEDVMRAKGTEAKGRQALEDEAAKQKTQAMLAEHNERCRREMEMLRDRLANSPSYIPLSLPAPQMSFADGIFVGVCLGGIIVGFCAYFFA